MLRVDSEKHLNTSAVTKRVRVKVTYATLVPRNNMCIALCNANGKLMSLNHQKGFAVIQK